LYGVVESRPVPENSNVMRDEVIVLVSQQEVGPEARLRRIEVWVEEKNETMVFVTNNLKLAARTIARIYKERWQIELFFRWVKQTLKIKHFLGRSENAVRIQIAVALIVFLLLRLAYGAQRTIHSLLAFARLVRANLMHKRPLDCLLDPPLPIVQNHRQLSLILCQN